MQEDHPAHRLSLIGIEDADSYIARLSDPDPRVIVEGALGLSWHIDPRKMGPLLRLLVHSDEGIRWAAATYC